MSMTVITTAMLHPCALDLAKMANYISACADSVDEFLPLEGAVSAVWKFLGFPGSVKVHTTHVHGVTLNDDEMKIKILTVLGEVQHPKYSYPLEKKGYTAWQVVKCVKYV